jgi:hypothetical protein
MNLPNLETLKKAFGLTLEHIRNNGSILQPSDNNQIDILEETLNSTTTLDQLAGLCLMPIKNRNIGMKPIESLNNSPLFTTSLQFGQATLEWYFMYGNCGSFSYNFIIFCIPTCIPSIANELGIKGQDGYIYSLTGGYGSNNGEWITIPLSYFQAIYNSPTQSTFSFEGVLDQNNPIKKCSFTSNEVGNFDLDVRWIDKILGVVGIKSNMKSRLAPYLNGPDGCVPCISGVGTLYWSYTNMNIQSTVGNELSGSGIGWFDHQWMQTGHLQSETLASLQNIENLITTPKPIRWFWITIQDYTTQEQYMVIVYIDEVLNKNNLPPPYTSSTVNHYSPIDGPKFLEGDSATVTVQKTFTTPDEKYI